MVSASLPFFKAPSLHKPSGLNLFPLGNDSAAFLGGALPDFIAQIRCHLEDGQTQVFTASVEGRVWTAYKPNESERQGVDLGSASSIDLHPGCLSLTSGTGLSSNNSHIYTSEWHHDNANCESNDDGAFRTELRGYSLERRDCNGTWAVSRADASSVNASCSDIPRQNQALVQNNWNALSQYLPLLAEHVPTKVYHGLTNTEKADLTVVAVGAMVWSRSTSLSGPENIDDPTQGNYEVCEFGCEELRYSASPVDAVVKANALETHWLLFLVLLIYPVSTLAMVLGKGMCYSTPLSEGFGIIALLFGISHESCEVLSGASLSGKLEQPVPVRIDVQDPYLNRGFGQVRYVMGERGRTGRLGKGQKYA